jgi:hypothetical protein
MPNTNRGSRSSLQKLCLSSVFALTALVPAVASANDSDFWAGAAKICYPNAQTCQILRGTAMWDEIQAMNMPYMLEVYCPGSAACSTSTPQKWGYWFDASPGYAGPYNISNPSGGTWVPYSPQPNLSTSCSQTGTGSYKCIAGTGGPGWSWVITISYW